MNFDTFNLKSPFTRFNLENIPRNKSIPNWQYIDSVPTFNHFVSTLQPPVIIELGSWAGWSAIEMAKACQILGIKSKILCIDTWLGSIEHWRIDQCNSLNIFEHFENGTSKLFDEFCRNVVSHGVEDYIIPLPTTTSMAFKLLKHLKITSKMIYVDASHETEDVVADLTNYYSLLEEGGVVFGDDVCWPSVQAAIDEFSIKNRIPVNYTQNKNLYYFIK